MLTILWKLCYKEIWNLPYVLLGEENSREFLLKCGPKPRLKAKNWSAYRSHGDEKHPTAKTETRKELTIKTFQLIKSVKNLKYRGKRLTISLMSFHSKMGIFLIKIKF